VKEPKEPIDFSHLGGKKVGHSMPVQTEKEIDFSAIGGKVVRRASQHPMFKTNSQGTNESEGSTVERPHATEGGNVDEEV